MRGKSLVILLLSFTVGFSLILYYFQVFAFYQRVDGLKTIKVLSRNVSINNYRGIDSETSGLKLRGCFFINPKEFAGFQELEKATPLSAPFWFDCFKRHEMFSKLSRLYNF